MKRQVILYIAMSLDGYIAKEDGNIDFLSTIDIPGEDFGYIEFIKTVDTLIWGRKTYDKLLSFGIDFPYRDKTCYVLSNSKTGADENVTFVSDIRALIEQLQTQEGQHIYCDGGGETVFELLSHSLIDRLIISVIPYLLGSGIRLFKDGRPEQGLTFKKSVPYPSGLVQLWYDKQAGQAL